MIITIPFDSSAIGAFADFDLDSRLERAIHAAGYSEPRPIQDLALGPALDGDDVLGLAQTGTGKTAAFALPILDHLLWRPRPGPRALIVAPTRELALQIHGEFERLARFTSIRVACLFGGVSEKPQIRALRESVDVIVACPGRLLDLMGRGFVNVEGLEILVLDEADHMLDMGFLPSIRRILRALPSERQNLLFSATMSAEIRELADKILRRPHVVELNHSKPAETIDHALYDVEEGGKMAMLEHLLVHDDFHSGIVFLRTKRRARQVAKRLAAAGHRAVALQGNMSQNARDRAMGGFRAGEYDVLVATDIAARGIDVAHVSHVINYDVPNTPDAYTHRIGRTGRGENLGRAFTFVQRDDATAVRAIEKRLGEVIDRGVVPSAIAAIPPKRAASPGRRQGGGRASAGGDGRRRSARGGGQSGRRGGVRVGAGGSAGPSRRGSRPGGRGRAEGMIGARPSARSGQ